MKAYAILDGGGVKGAALVGALQAAKDRGIQFVGYGGTSAGSIVALLSSVGYIPEEVRDIMIDEIQFTDFIDQSEGDLDNIKAIFEKNFKLIGEGINLWKLWNNRKLLEELLQILGELNQTLGLCDANGLKDFLLNKIKEKILGLNLKNDITFKDLLDNKCLPLKVVASDLMSHRAIVYPSEQEGGLNYSVIDAVRASMSFPVVFRPLNINNRFLVDGGLSTNLPIFLFEQERKKNNYPVFAFDLIVDKKSSEDIDSESRPNIAPGNDAYGLINFCRDMLSTILEASDDLLEQLVRPAVYYIPIPIPKYIGTLDFSLSKDKRCILFDKGNSVVSSYLNIKFFENLKKAREEREREKIRVLKGRIDLINKSLERLAEEVEDCSNADNVRVYIMFPTKRNTLLVTYQYGMDKEDLDIDWEIPLNAGVSGYVWTHRKPAMVGINDMRSNPQNYYLTQSQLNRIRKDRQAIYSVPMFDLRNQSLEANEDDVRNPESSKLKNLGILSVDTSTPLENTLWLDEDSPILVKLKFWADVLSLIF